MDGEGESGGVEREGLTAVQAYMYVVTCEADPWLLRGVVSLTHLAGINTTRWEGLHMTIQVLAPRLWGHSKHCCL